MAATNKNGYTVYEYLSYAAQHPGWDYVYGHMTTQCRGRIGVHWRTNGNQFTVESLDTSVNAIWGNGWYRGGVHMSLAIGEQFLTVVDPGGGTVGAGSHRIYKKPIKIGAFFSSGFLPENSRKEKPY